MNVVALPSTLTGSIGVLGGKPVVASLLDRAGIGTDAATAAARTVPGAAVAAGDVAARPGVVAASLGRQAR